LLWPALLEDPQHEQAVDELGAICRAISSGLGWSEAG
jgi:hypothetical protein